MTQTTNILPDPDLEWCYTVIDDVSRTFALSIHELDNPVSDELCVGYLLCRVPDTIEDSPHIPPTEKAELLDSYTEMLDPEQPTTVADFMGRVEEWVPETDSADWRVVDETPRLVATFRDLPRASRNEIRAPVQEMTRGMEMFVERYSDEDGLRLQTMDELREYSWYVAGTVGELITRLVTRDTDLSDEDEMLELAESFGLLLQIVNVTKDIVEDYVVEDNVYVPETVLSNHGLSHKDIEPGVEGDSFVPVVERLVSEAKQYVADAEEWLRRVPEKRGNTVKASALPFLLAVATLRELENRPEDVFSDESVKVSREEVGALLSVVGSEASPGVSRLREVVETQALTDPSVL